MKTDLTTRQPGFWRELLRGQDAGDAFEDVHDGGLMEVEALLEFALQGGEPASELLRAAEELAHAHESPHHIDAHPDCARAVEDVCGHDGAVFGKGRRQRGRETEGGEVVAICDHLCFFVRAQAEQKIAGEPPGIAFDLFHEPFGGHPIEAGEIGIEDDSMAADVKDEGGKIRGSGWQKRRRSPRFHAASLWGGRCSVERSRSSG